MIAPTEANRKETLLSYYKRVYAPMKLRGAAESSRRQYLINLRHVDKFLERPATLDDLNDETIGALLGSFLDRGCSPATANKCRNHVLALWRYAARKHHVPDFPDVARLAEYKRHPTAWTTDQLTALLSVASNFQMGNSEAMRCGMAPGLAPRVWWPAILLVLYDTGIRIGAALALRCSDYDPSSRRLFVRAESQKQKADQVFFLSEQTAELLSASINASPGRELLFPWPGNLFTLWKWYGNMLKTAGLPHGRRDKFHKLRCTSATMAELHAGRGTATGHLGHSSPKVTERYIDTSMLPDCDVATHLPRPALIMAVSAEYELADLLNTYAAHCAVSGRNERATKYQRDRVQMVRKTLGDCGITSMAMLYAETIQQYLLGLEHTATRSHRRTATVKFLRWLVSERRVHGAALSCLVELEQVKVHGGAIV